MSKPSMPLGTQIVESTEDRVVVRRVTRESVIEVAVDTHERREGRIEAGLVFLSHMLEHISWRGCFNIATEVELPHYKLTHVICEDVGIVLGTALYTLVGNRTARGVNGSGVSVAVLDEAMAQALVSIEGRSGLFLDTHGHELAELVEDMQAQDLIAFLEGLSNGMKATIHVDLFKGRNPHHIWESVFRAFGEAMRQALAPNEWRRGTIVGTKGTFE